MKRMLIATIVAALGLCNAAARADTASASLDDIHFIGYDAAGQAAAYTLLNGSTLMQVLTDDIPLVTIPVDPGFNTIGGGSVHSDATGASASANIDTRSVPGSMSVLADAPGTSFAGSRIENEGFLDVPPFSTATISGTYTFFASDAAASTAVDLCFRPTTSDVSTCASRTDAGSGTVDLLLTYVNASPDWADLLTTMDMLAYAQYVPHVVEVPEPSGALLSCVGAFALAGLGQRRRWLRKAAAGHRRPRAARLAPAGLARRERPVHRVATNPADSPGGTPHRLA